MKITEPATQCSALKLQISHATTNINALLAEHQRLKTRSRSAWHWLYNSANKSHGALHWCPGRCSDQFIQISKHNNMRHEKCKVNWLIPQQPCRHRKRRAISFVFVDMVQSTAAQENSGHWVKKTRRSDATLHQLLSWDQAPFSTPVSVMGRPTTTTGVEDC